MRSSPYIVAEISANHLGSYERAFRLVRAAEIAGANAVKFQTFSPEQMVDDKVLESGPWAGRNALALYREAQTPRDWHPGLFHAARECGIEPFSSVFHPEDVDFLETLSCQTYKIASFELTDLDLIGYAASTGRWLILSTGMASMREIGDAVNAAHRAGKITLLKCTSAYPARAEDANLATMEHMQQTFGCGVGLSDHSEGHAVAVAATVLGARVIEKHLTLKRSDGGPDAGFSMEPEEFAVMVRACREASSAIGEVRYGPTPSEAHSLALRRPSGGKRGSTRGDQHGRA